MPSPLSITSSTATPAATYKPESTFFTRGNQQLIVTKTFLIGLRVRCYHDMAALFMRFRQSQHSSPVNPFWRNFTWLNVKWRLFCVGTCCYLLTDRQCGRSAISLPIKNWQSTGRISCCRLVAINSAATGFVCRVNIDLHFITTAQFRCPTQNQ